MFLKDQQSLIWKHDHHILLIQPWGKDSLRCRARAYGEVLNDLPGALLSPQAVEPHIEIGEQEAVIRNGAIEARVGQRGRVRLLNAATGQPLLEEVEWDPDWNLYPHGRSFKAVGGDLYHTEARFMAYEEEHLYGLGQHRHGFLDQKGCVVELFQRNAEICIPFLLSSRGYGFLWHNPGIGRVELGTNGTRWVADGTRQMDYYITTGDSFAHIMEHYADATGHAPVFPAWAAGFWQCKLRYRTQDELLAVAREYKRRGLPLAVIVVDFFHWTRLGEWEWDKECWPDPAAMIKELGEMGIRLMVSVWGAVNPLSKNAAEMKQRGLLIQTDRGLPLLFPLGDVKDPSPVFTYYYDAMNPEAREYVWNKVRENYHKIGVQVFWLDACEPEIFPIDLDNLRFYAGAGLEVASLYPLGHARGFYEGMQAAGQEEILNLCRSAWAGSQRYGAAIWSGDIPSTWEMLRIQVRAGLNIGLSGIPWWTTDIGGFYGGDVNDPHFRELLVRWFQYGVFCPLFRLHGYRQPAIPGLAGTGGPNEIWAFGDEVYEIIKELLFLRERLQPYIVEQMRLASLTGIPPMRPLFFDFAHDKNCFAVEDELLFGPDILVAPVLHEGARSREVYLPAGTHWTDAWTGKRLEGGKWVQADAPLARIPLYLRGDADLPVGRNC